MNSKLELYRVILVPSGGDGIYTIAESVTLEEGAQAVREIERAWEAWSEAGFPGNQSEKPSGNFERYVADSVRYLESSDVYAQSLTNPNEEYLLSDTEPYVWERWDQSP